MKKDNKKFLIDRLVVNEVSLVDNPANAEAKVVLFKRNNSDIVLQGSNSGERENMNIEELKKALEAKEAEIASLKKSNEDLEKAAADAKSQADEIAKKQEELSAEIEKMKAEKETGKKKESADDEDEMEAMKKSLGEEFSAKFEELTKKAELAVELEKRLEMQNLEKVAEKEYPSLPGSASDKAELLKAISGMPEDTRKFAEQVLKSANASIEKSFEEVGKSGGVLIGSNEDKINKIAEKIREEHPTMSKPDSIAKALETPEGMAIYQDSVKEYESKKYN